jgi:sulfinoalanine decarboxylase/sulfinoalanine decarboxylase/aspartate 1-decarboxylase
MGKKTSIQKDLSLFNEIVNELLDEELKTPVAKPISPKCLNTEVDLAISDYPMMDNQFKESIKNLILKTPKTASHQFFNQLFGGRNSKAILGDLLAVILNNSMYTYKVAGVQVGVEKAIISKIGELINYPITCDGTFAPGGSMSNFMAMVMARDSKNADTSFSGITSTYTLYTSNQSHYSISKNAAFIGVGRDNVRFIDTNYRGEMNLVDLEDKIEMDLKNGRIPFFVNATAGTTVLGAFDSINDISSICKKHHLWLHVDGAYSGAVIFSNKYKNLIKGIEKSDSFSLNAHKMIGTPLTCSVFITPHKKSLYASFSNDANYLYQTDDDDYNLGKTSMQCGRRNDALKFWTLWKAVGTLGLEKIVDHQFHLADYARNYINNHPDYTLYSFDNSLSICFNYKDIPAKKLCSMLYEKAILMVGYGNIKNKDFIRLVTVNAQNSTDDIQHFFNTLEKFTSENIALTTSLKKEIIVE